MIAAGAHAQQAGASSNGMQIDNDHEMASGGVQPSTQLASIVQSPEHLAACNAAQHASREAGPDLKGIGQAASALGSNHVSFEGSGRRVAGPDILMKLPESNAASCDMQDASQGAAPSQKRPSQHMATALKQPIHQSVHAEVSLVQSPYEARAGQLLDMHDAILPGQALALPAATHADAAGSKPGVPDGASPGVAQHASETIKAATQGRPGATASRVVRLVRPPGHASLTSGVNLVSPVCHAEAPAPQAQAAARPMPPAELLLRGSPNTSTTGHQQAYGSRHHQEPLGQAAAAAIPRADTKSPLGRRHKNADKENSTPSAVRPARPAPRLPGRSSHAKMVLAAFSASHGADAQQHITSPEHSIHLTAPARYGQSTDLSQAPALGLPHATDPATQQSTPEHTHATAGPCQVFLCEASSALSPLMPRHTSQQSQLAAGGSGGSPHEAVLPLQTGSPEVETQSSVKYPAGRDAVISCLASSSVDARPSADPITAGGLIVQAQA